MATYTEYLADALREWRREERTLRRLQEDGREAWETRDNEKRCADAFAKAIDSHLMKHANKGELLVIREAVVP